MWILGLKGLKRLFHGGTSRKKCKNQTNKINVEKTRKNAQWVFSWRQNCRQPDYVSQVCGPSYWNCTSQTEKDEETYAYKNEVLLKFCGDLSVGISAFMWRYWNEPGTNRRRQLMPDMSKHTSGKMYGMWSHNLMLHQNVNSLQNKSEEIAVVMRDLRAHLAF